MATEAPNWYVTKFIDKAVTVFQNRGHLLRGAVMDPGRIVGSQATWMIAGRGEAQPLIRGNFGAAMNAPRSNLTVTMADWQAADWVYETDIEKMTVNEQDAVAEACGAALGRRSDLLLINELNANSLTIVGDGTTPFTLPMALQAMIQLQNNEVEFDDGMIFCGLPPLAWAQFTSYRQVNDADWVGYDGQVYKTGAKMKDWNGVKFFRIPQAYAPTPAANQQDCFMWHKRAVGYATNYDVRTTVTWENLYTGWYHNSRFAAAAKMLLPPGVIRLRYASNSPVTIN